MPLSAPPSTQTLQALDRAYRSGALPLEVIERVIAAIAGDDVAWIHRATPEQLRAAAQALPAPQYADRARLPLYGVPFAVKDNIDVAGWPTTAACPAFSYTAQQTATAVQRLLDAGAILVGKTNLDQFATGLVGTRSPFGAVPNSFDPAYVSGGSSSGSASVVARGLVSFALGTDTAGSGRVPAGFNNIVGLKPTRGLVPTSGVVPACRSLDCVSVFALTCADAASVLNVIAGHDDSDSFSRRARPAASTRLHRLGVPAIAEFFGDRRQAQAWNEALKHARALGHELVELDFGTLHETAALLYDGPWVAERYAAIREFFDGAPTQIEPSVRAIIGRGRHYSAADLFAGQYRLAQLQRENEALLAQVDALLVPTAPRLPRLDEVAADPIGVNAQLGHYTNFVNLLDLAALALPARLRSDGLPFGVTLIAPAFSEAALLEFGQRWQQSLALPLGATGALLPDDPLPPIASAPRVRLAVVGAHLTGMPLNRELTERNARRIAQTTTAPRYRLFALSNTQPPKPGLLRDEAEGRAIAIEVWELGELEFGSFVAGVPAPLGIGSLELADGSWVKGFICEPWALRDARDISSFGGWRGYVEAAAGAPAFPA